jgi:hypothetical protein
MTQHEKQKAIAVAFAPYAEWSNLKYEESYNNWILTEEGKRLTAEDRSEPEQPAINVLIKISKQLDRIEGRMKIEPNRTIEETRANDIANKIVNQK